MAKRWVRFTFPEALITEPVIYELGQRFQVVTNIRRAKVERDKGWVVVQLEGKTKNIQEGITWAAARGVIVEGVVEEGKSPSAR